VESRESRKKEGILQKARIRIFGRRDPTPEPPPGDGELIEVYEGGKFIGYERTRPEKKWLPGIR
jgi:hypothetical protein